MMAAFRVSALPLLFFWARGGVSQTTTVSADNTVGSWVIDGNDGLSEYTRATTRCLLMWGLTEGAALE